MPEYIEAKIRLLEPEKGGRQNPLFAYYGQYRPHLRVGAEGEYMGVSFEDGPTEISFDTECTVTLRPLYPEVDYSSLSPGTDFDILEGPCIVGFGTVIERWSIE